MRAGCAMPTSIARCCHAVNYTLQRSANKPNPHLPILEGPDDARITRAGLGRDEWWAKEALTSSRPGRRRESLHVDFPFPLTHGVAVMPCLHAQQGIHADAESLFEPIRHN